MKKTLLIAFLFMGSLFFLESCSPYYYDNYYSRPAPRVYVRPSVPYYSPPPPPPPSYRYRRHHGYRSYRRY